MADDLDIDAAWYLSAYPDVAAAGCDPVEHYRLYGRAEGRLPRAVAALALNEKLWGGFSRWALAQPKISVIMPVYNAAPFIGTALRSLLAQTWTHFEVIVVDDASTDDTLAVVQTAVKDDPRVVIIQQPRNRGAYAARNAGLRRVTGEFITTHDADDWSHPQKLERLAATLLADASLMGVLGHWVRADTDLHFLQCWPTEKGFIHPTVSSFLFRRQALARLGGWERSRLREIRSFTSG